MVLARRLEWQNCDHKTALSNTWTGYENLGRRLEEYTPLYRGTETEIVVEYVLMAKIIQRLSLLKMCNPRRHIYVIHPLITAVIPPVGGIYLFLLVFQVVMSAVRDEVECSCPHISLGQTTSEDKYSL